MLVTERPGACAHIENGVLDPTPIGPMPQMLATGLGGLLDVALHPRFAAEPADLSDLLQAGEGAGQRDDGGLRALLGRRIDAHRRERHPRRRRIARRTGQRRRASGRPAAATARGSRWTAAGLLYVTLGDRNYPPKSQNPASHIGKILRIRDDGSVPADNPFVSRPGYKPEIYSLGHRNPLGLAIHPTTGELWSTEQGPQGGDELNKIEAGKNYGWPRVSLGRNYDGTRVGEGFSAPGLEEPVVFWVPAIAISGLSFYDGDKFPAWNGNALRRRHAQQHRAAHSARAVQRARASRPAARSSSAS